MIQEEELEEVLRACLQECLIIDELISCFKLYLYIRLLLMITYIDINL